MVAFVCGAAMVAVITVVTSSAELAAARKFVPPPLPVPFLMPALEQQIEALRPKPAVDVGPLSADLSSPSREQLMQIYCSGDLLREVQLAALFEDSKHFVDMPIKATISAAAVLAELPALLRQRGLLNASEWRARLERFVDDHFDPPGADLVPTAPRDFQDSVVPAAIAQIAHPKLREWALKVHAIWKQLGRVPSNGVASSFMQAKPIAAASDSPLARPEGHEHNVLIVPGGRFRESYYWDSYWIVHGLLASGLRVTARGVVNNLLEYVAEFGFVPNGGRIYYLTRSQPPLLSDMVRLVATNGTSVAAESAEDWDLEYLRAALPLLEREYAFWMRRGDNSSLVEVQAPDSEATYALNRYVASANAPRPESFREDYLHARMGSAVANATAAEGPHHTEDEDESHHTFYNEIIAAAESGWDFSSRWFTDETTLRSIATSQVIPVELNAALFRVEANLARFHSLLGDAESASRFSCAAEQRKQSMDAVLWSDAHGTWKDYWWHERHHSEVSSVSDYSPLWARAFDPDGDKDRVAKAVASLASSGLVLQGGAQTTTRATGQQWDAPNAWPPEQDRLVEGLLATQLPEAEALAKQLVESWIATGYVAWTRTGQMFEKYNATELGGIGSGGEYVPQLGFGWSNGVLLRFLTEYEHLVDANAALALAASVHGL